MKHKLICFAALICAAGILRAAVVNGWLDLPRISAPANPASGLGRLFINTSTSKLDCLNPDGTICAPLGSSGAPYYSSLNTSQTSVTIPGATHGFTATPCALAVMVYDDSSPRRLLAPDGAPPLTVDPTTCDVAVKFSAPTTFYVAINGGVGPAGTNGTDGINGAAATISVGAVTTGAPGSSVLITNSGTSSAAILSFTIPRGDTGAPGYGDMSSDTYDPAGRAAQVLTVSDFGTTAGKVAQGNDSRFMRTVRSAGVTFDGGGSVLSGTLTRCGLVDFAGTIQSATIFADIAGSATVDVKTVAYPSYTGPASTSSIAAAAKPTLSNAITSQNTTLTGWDTSIAANTMVCYVLTSPATAHWVTVDLKVLPN